MSSATRLTIAYIKKSPESAGRVLSAMSTADSAAFIAQIPTRYGVQVFARLNPVVAARLMQELESTVAAALLRDLDFAEASAIVRQLSSADRNRFLADLPRRLVRDLEKALAYTEGSVGAQMTTAIATLGESDTVADALAIVRQAERDSIEVIFVLDEKRRLVGAVTAVLFLRHAKETLLSEILDASCVSISAHARLETIKDLDAWHDYSQLPVFSRRREIVGMISRKRLRRVQQAEIAAMYADSPTMLASMLTTLVITATGLLELLTTSPDSLENHGERNER